MGVPFVGLDVAVFHQKLVQVVDVATVFANGFGRFAVQEPFVRVFVLPRPPFVGLTSLLGLTGRVGLGLTGRGGGVTGRQCLVSLFTIFLFRI